MTPRALLRLRLRLAAVRYDGDRTAHYRAVTWARIAHARGEEAGRSVLGLLETSRV